MSTAFARTAEHAAATGWRGEFIDDDCVIFRRGAVQIQVVFDNYSPSWSFISSVITDQYGDWTTPTRLGSFAAVRKAMSAPRPEVSTPVLSGLVQEFFG